MKIYQRGNTWCVDLRAEGGDRQSLFTTHKDTARILALELAQRCLKGEQITSQVVRALRDAATSPMARVTAQVLGAAPPKPDAAAVVEAKQRAGITVHGAFDLAKLFREKWSEAKAFHTIEAHYNHVAEYFGATRPLSEITQSDVEDYWRGLREDELSPSTINSRLSMVSVLFTSAQQQGHPVICPSMRVLRRKPNKGRTFTVTPALEARTLAWFAEGRWAFDLHMHDLCACLVDTGFRLSEMLRVDEARCISWDTGSLRALDTKNGENRTIPMTRRVRAILEQRVKDHGPRPFAAVGLATNASHRWKTMRDSPEIAMTHESEFVIHALRHTCATRLAERGMNAFEIAQWMGHTDLKTTKIYVNLTSRHLEKCRDALEQPVPQPAAPAQPAAEKILACQ